MRPFSYLSVLLLAFGAPSLAGAQDITGDWYGGQSMYRFLPGGAYEYAAQIDSSSGGCGLRISEKSGGSWTLQGATLTLARRAGSVDSVDTCSGSQKHKELSSETTRYGVRLEPGGAGPVLVVDDPRYGEERYQRR
jgi:hypothetical protein